MNKDYLHPKWQKLSASIKNRDNWQCVGCFDAESNLQAHHIIYLPGVKVWDHPPELLQTLCDSCHQRRREIIRKACDALKIAVAHIPTDRLEGVAQKLISVAMEELES